MSEQSQKLLLIDGHSLAYRAFYALPVENFSTTTGQSTNAVFGFVSMLLNVCRDEAPSHIAVAFDLGRETFRLAEYSEYKAGRAKTPDEFHGQVEIIKDVLAAMNIAVVTKENYEADDVLATLAQQGEHAGIDTYVITGDKDSFQLARDGVTILYPKRGVSDLSRMTPAAIEEKYGVTPANYRGLAALVGEKADNLPGVPGVGDKTAAKWLVKYGDLPAVIDNAEDIGGKVGGNLREHLDNVERNYRLNELIDDLELPVAIDDVTWTGVDRPAVSELFDQLEFRQLGARLDALVGQDETPAEVPASFLPEAAVADSDALVEWLQGTDAEALVAVATNGTYELGSGSVDVIGLATEDSAIAFDLTTLDPVAVEALSGFLTSHLSLAFHGAKTQLKALADAGYRDVRLAIDTEIGGYLLEPGARSYDLAELAGTHCGISLTEPSDDGQLALDLDDGSERLTAFGQAAAAIARLAPVLTAEVDAAGMAGVLREIEVPLVQVLADMEHTGIAIDRSELSALIDEFTRQAETCAQQAYEAIGHEVNLNSPKQLQVVLFEELDLPKTRKTRTGYTTNAEALADLYIKSEHPFLEHLLAHRDVIKLKQTVAGLERMVADDGRIHTVYQQTIAATGRLSSTDPNLQNIPVRTEAGRRIRHVFVSEADAGYTDLISADYSQIEMRIMAHLSGDESLIAAFNAGEDLHSYVGSKVFNVGVDEVSAEMRAKVKAMSYGLVYGLSAFGLSRQLRISVDEARGLMEGYFERFGAVKDYLDEIVAEARGRGYTETMYGRRRYLPELGSSNRQIREMAERAALNAPIQGSAADIMKIAMLNLRDAFAASDLKSRMLLQVHDEIIVELADGEREAVSEVLRTTMGQAAELSVPLDVNIGVGRSWQDAAH